MSNLVAGCNPDKIDRIALDISNISDQIISYLNKIEDEIYNLKGCCDIVSVGLLKQHFESLKSNFKNLDYNYTKTFEDLVKVKIHYSNLDSDLKVTVNRAINNIDVK